MKIFILSGAETLTLQAADALLKTLEEPQPHVAIILAASEVDALPPTVVSRCQVLALHSVAVSSIRAALDTSGVPPEEAERLAKLAQGSVGWALQASKQPKLAIQQEEMVERLSALMDMNLEARLQLVEALSANRKDRAAIHRHMEILLLIARDLLLLSQGLPAQLASGERQDALRRQAGRLGLPVIQDYLQKLRLTMARIEQNVDPRLALEALVVSIP